MNKNVLFLVSAIILLSIPCSSFVQAQGGASARLKGKVTDAQTGEPLIGTNIAIMGTSLGTSTNLDGEYVISGVPAGAQMVVFRYIGYKNIDKSGIQFQSGETLELNMEMSGEAIMGEEVVITVQAKGQRAAINQQLSSNAITNIVSSDKIRDVPDVNAAESIGRLPGVSLKRSGGEGNKVVIRGLSPQYTIVQVDGVRLTGVDMDRSVGLSTISSEMLDGIELSKSLTADKDADAIGGVVNLRTRVAQEGFHFDLLARGGYNSLENRLSDNKIGATVSNRFFDNKLGVLGSYSQEHVVRSSDRFSAGYGKNITIDASELYTNNASVTEVISDRYRKNGSLVLDFKNDFMNLKFNNFYSHMVNDNDSRNNQFRFSNSDFQLIMDRSRPVESIQSHSLKSSFNIAGSVLDIGLSYSHTKLESTSLHYEFQDQQVLGGSSIASNVRLFAQPDDLIEEYYDITSPDFAYLLTTYRDTLVRDDVSKTVSLNWKIPFRLSNLVSGHLKIGGKYSKKDRSSDRERIEGYYHGGIGGDRMDIIYARNPEFLKVGDIPGMQSVVGIPALNFYDPNYDYGEILNGAYELGWSADFEQLQDVHSDAYDAEYAKMLLRMGAPSAENDYRNSEERIAGYAMAEINIGRRIMILPGLRYERMQTEYYAQFVMTDPFAPDGILIGYPQDVSVTDRINQDWFPSLNAKVDVTDWMDVRAAYYKSTSRPDYRFLSPGLTTDQDRRRMTAFNPYLNPSLAHNYDLGVSFFANKLGLITLNGFYKEINELIYRLPVYQPEYFDRVEGAPESLIESLAKPRELYPEDLIRETGTSIPNYPINNPNKATFAGFEISTQTNFWYLPGLLSGLVLDLNFSMIWSQTAYPFLEIETVWDETVFPPKPTEIPNYNTREGRMLDQPASLFNARIGWDYKGFSTRLSFRYQGETLQSLDPVHDLLDEVSGALFRIDLSAKQDITKRLSIALDVANLNQFMEESYLYALDYVMPRGSQFYGMTAQMSLRYNF